MWLCYFTIFTTTRRWRNTTPYVTSGFILSVSRHLITHTYALEWFTDFADQSGLSDTTYNEKWDAKKFTINARLKILTRLMLNRVNRRVNAINPAALVLAHLKKLFQWPVSTTIHHQPCARHDVVTVYKLLCFHCRWCNCMEEISLFDDISVLVDAELYIEVVDVLSADSQLVIQCRTFQLEQTQWNTHRKQHYLAFQILSTHYFLCTNRTQRPGSENQPVPAAFDLLTLE